MNKLFFTPLSIVSGMIAGLVAAKLFEALWAKAMNEDAPDPKYRENDWRKLIAALAVEGAIYRVVKGATDHGARVAYAKSIGGWPGEESAEVHNA